MSAVATLDLAPPAAEDAHSRVLTLQEASSEGWGHPSTLRKRVKSGRLPAARIDDRGTYVIRESDLMRQPDLLRLRRSRNLPLPACVQGTASTPPELDDLAFLASRLVATWPRLSDERKRELGQLLAAA